MRTIKFRFWSPQGESFVQNYNYNGPVDELFDEREWRILVPSQYTGMKDCEEKEIWEGDILEYERQLTNKDSQKYTAVVSYADAAYLLSVKAMSSEGTLAHMWLHDLSNAIYKSKVKVIGNKFENPELT
jgi:uncharacterized phage protein (TIGR01671 family)